MPAEQIREFRLLAEALTIEGGFLTPTLKVKRRIVNQRFADLNQRLDGFREDTNRRFDDSRSDVNQRFADLNQRFTTLTWMITVWFSLLTILMIMFKFLKL